MSEANKTQIGGGHYKGTGYEHWDFVIFRLDGRYLEGCITKYVARHRKKNGLQDVQKARHYTAKLIELYNSGFVAGMPYEDKTANVGAYSTRNFLDKNGLDDTERRIIAGLTTWRCRIDLNAIARLIDELIEEYEAAEREAAEANAAYTNQG